MSVRDSVGIGQGLLGVGGVEDFTTLLGAVDQKSAIFIDGDHVALPGDNPADPGLAANTIANHIVLGIVALEPEANEKIAVLHRWKHGVAAHLRDQEHLSEQDPANGGEKHDPRQQAHIALPVQDAVSPFGDDRGNGCVVSD